MGRAKDEMMGRKEAKEMRFDMIAHKNNWVCLVCDKLIQEDDEMSYFSHKMCNYCSHVMNSDD